MGAAESVGEFRQGRNPRSVVERERSGFLKLESRHLPGSAPPFYRKYTSATITRSTTTAMGIYIGPSACWWSKRYAVTIGPTSLRSALRRLAGCSAKGVCWPAEAVEMDGRIAGYGRTAAGLQAACHTLEHKAQYGRVGKQHRPRPAARLPSNGCGSILPPQCQRPSAPSATWRASSVARRKSEEISTSSTYRAANAATNGRSQSSEKRHGQRLSPVKKNSPKDWAPAGDSDR